MKLTVAIFGVFGLAACDMVPFTPQNRIEAAKAKIAVHTANPTSVKWGEVKVGPGGAVCGSFNAETQRYGDPIWSGPTYFVTIKGEPNVIDAYSDCEGGVGVLASCMNDGDEAKVKEAIESCKVFQVEEEERANEHTADLMRSAGLVATGDRERDQTTWDAYIRASRTESVNIWDRKELSVSVESGNLFKRTYNAAMRKLPKSARTAEKVAAAQAATTEATAASEQYLEENGVV